MKPHYLYAAVIVLTAAFASCRKDENPPEPQRAQMTMTTQEQGEVWICLNGSGTAIIDWGDGSEPDTVSVTPSNRPHRFMHVFSGVSVRTTVVYGQWITYFQCYVNNETSLQITGLDVSRNTALEYLDYSNNQITSLDVSKNTALYFLNCTNNQITGLDVSKNTALEVLFCTNNQITSLDVSGNTALGSLDCSDNQITGLDVSKNTALEYLYCYDNQITTLDVSKNTALGSLDCSDNQITGLDVSKNTALENLFCTNNQITGLDVSKNTALEYLNCINNQITTLDVSKNTALYFLDCSNDAFDIAGLNALFGTLHGNGGTIYIGGNSGTAGCDRSIATKKGWRVIDL